MQRNQTFKASKQREPVKNKLERILGFPYLIILIVLILTPMLFVVLYAFNDSTSNNAFDIALTLDNFLNFLKEPVFLKVLGESLYIALLSTAFTLLIAYPLSYFMTRMNKQLQKIFILLVTAPMWINMMIRTLAVRQMINLTISSLLGSNTAIIIGMVYIYLPFMVLPIYTSLLKIDDNLYESAADLGANKIKTLFRVTIPLSLSGVLSGVMMVFLPTATALIVPAFLGNNKFMIGTLIENYMLNDNNFGAGAAISIVMIAIIMLFVYTIKKTDKYKGYDDEKV